MLILVLTGCHKDVLSRSDSGKTFTYNLGQKFTVQLLENPTTGYMWRFKTVPEMVVSPIEDYLEKPKTNRLGAAGNHLFVFQAVNQGETELQAFHARPWGVVGQDQPTLTYKIIVR